MTIQKLTTEDMLLVLPDGYVKTKTYPLFIHLHGMGGQQGLDSLIAGELPLEIQKAVDKFQIVVIAPHTAGNWAIAHTDKALTYARANLSINWLKVYLGGLSLGGDGVTRYISASITNASKFAAVVVSCGINSITNAKNIADSKLPCIFFHAADDATVSVTNSRNAVSSINAFSMPVPAKLVEYSGGQHWIWNKVFNATERPWTGNESPATVYDWMLMNEVGKPVAVPIMTTPTGLTAKAAFVIKDGQILLDGQASTGYDSIAWTDKSAVKSTWVGGTGWKTAISRPAAAGTYVFELKVGKGGVFVTDTVTVIFGTPAPGFKPTHTITHADGSKEDVQIGTL